MTRLSKAQKELLSVLANDTDDTIRIVDIWRLGRGLSWHYRLVSLSSGDRTFGAINKDYFTGLDGRYMLPNARPHMRLVWSVNWSTVTALKKRGLLEEQKVRYSMDIRRMVITDEGRKATQETTE